MFKALVAGVPEEGKAFIVEALTPAFGDVEVLDVNVDIDRLEVREANNDSTVVFVSFDKVSEGRSSSYAESIIKSDKYYSYDSLSGLVAWLNENHGVSLKAPEEHSMSLDYADIAHIERDTEEADVEKAIAAIARATGGLPAKAVSARVVPALSASENAELETLKLSYVELTKERDRLESSVASKELQIQNLSAQLEEYRDPEYDSGVSATKLMSLEAEIRTLQEQNRIDSSKLSHATRTLEIKSTEVESLKLQLETALTDVDRERRNSTSSAVRIGDLDREVQSLRIIVSDAEAMRGRVTEAERKAREAESSLRLLTVENVRQREELHTKDVLLEHHQTAGAKPTVDTEMLAELETLRANKERVANFEKETGEYIDGLESKIAGYEAEIEENKSIIANAGIVLQEVEALRNQVKNLSEDMLEKDQTIISLRTSQESNSESVSEAQSAVEYATKFKNSIFGRLSATALPRTPPAPIELGSARYGNLMFFFSGNAESSLGVYGRIKQLTQGVASRNIKGIVLDLSGESNLDYAFETVVQADTEWLEKGGEISKHLVSANKTAGVSLMSVSTGQFLNPSYLLTIDWNKRLNELNNSGYKVFVYLGSVGDLVGQVFFQSLAGRGRTQVYAKGDVSSLRYLYANLRRLGVKKSTVVHVYDLVDNQRVNKMMKAVDALGYSVKLETRGRSAR